jgi:hypothetical protein
LVEPGDFGHLWNLIAPFGNLRLIVEEDMFGPAMSRGPASFTFRMVVRGDNLLYRFFSWSTCQLLISIYQSYRARKLQANTMANILLADDNLP